MSLTQSLIEQGKIASMARRKAAAAKLRELLLRDAHPDKGDAEALVVACDVLRIAPADLPPLLELVRNLAKCEALAPNVATLQLERERKNVAVQDAIAWGEKARADLDAQIKTKLGPLVQAQNNVEARYNDAKAASGRVALLQDEWAAFVEQRDLEDVRRERLAAENAAAVEST